MAQVNFTAMCMATYQSALEVPDDIARDRDKALKYVRDHLNDAPVADVEWLEDVDPYEAVTEEDIKSITGLDEDEAEVPVMTI